MNVDNTPGFPTLSQLDVYPPGDTSQAHWPASNKQIKSIDRFQLYVVLTGELDLADDE